MEGFGFFNGELLVSRNDILDTVNNLLNIGFGEFALLECHVRFYAAVGVKNDGDFGILRNVVAFGASGTFDRKDGFLDPFALGQILELLVHTFFIVEENNEASHGSAGVLLGGFINFLDELGEVAIDIAGKNHRNRIGTIAANEATLVAFVGAIAMKRAEWSRGFSNLRTGLQIRGRISLGGTNHKGKSKT